MVQSVESVTSERAFSDNGREKSGGGCPKAKEKDDELVDGAGDTGALGRHGGKDSGVAAEDVRGHAAAARELVIQTARDDNPEKFVVGQEATPRSVHSSTHRLR